jgi:hypothetical protein
MAVVNGCIAYNLENPKKLTHRKFWEAVIDGLVAGFERRIAKKRGCKISTPLDVRLAGRHFPAQYEDKKHKPNCSVCSIMRANCTK